MYFKINGQNYQVKENYEDEEDRKNNYYIPILSILVVLALGSLAVKCVKYKKK